jgi:hypothetical protein
VVYSPETLLSVSSALHGVVLAVLVHVKSLRSLVARNAMMAFVDMFQHLGRNMDPELDAIVVVLLTRIAEGNAFLVRHTRVVRCCVRSLLRCQRASSRHVFAAVIGGVASVIAVVIVVVVVAGAVIIAAVLLFAGRRVRRQRGRCKRSSTTAPRARCWRRCARK